MIQVDTKKCCGCSLCEKVCTHNAIHMVKDAMGFAYPHIEIDLCVDCGLCDRVCPFQQPKSETVLPQIGFAVRHKNIAEVKKSRSGAFFVALSDWILNNGGVVYGAGFGNHFKVKHKRAANPFERDEFRGSKYAQSDCQVYEQVKKDLQQAIPVLFTGTPCQVAAIRAYIPSKLHKYLYCADIVCHGVASPRVWDDFISYVEGFERKKLIKVSFRDKLKFGWSGLHRESYVFSPNIKRTFPFTYYQSFLLRQSCSYCPFSSLDRPADITLGDFWGWEKAVPNFVNDDLGVSLVICNTDKGKMAFEAIASQLFTVQVPISDCLQPNLLHPTEENKIRKTFSEEYKQYGFNFVLKKYWKITPIDWIKFYAKRILEK